MNEYEIELDLRDFDNNKNFIKSIINEIKRCENKKKSKDCKYKYNVKALVHEKNKIIR